MIYQAELCSASGAKGPGSTPLADINTERYTFAAVGLGGQLFAMGDESGDDMKTVSVYTPSTNKWAATASMGTKRQWAAAMAL